MAKVKKQFRCKSCDHTSPRWVGRCPSCGAWESMEEELSGGNTAAATVAAVAQSNAPRASIVKLGDAVEAPMRRLKSSFDEFDRVLGGGIVPGSVVLLGGDPGIGKSTILLQASGRMLAAGHRVIYVAGEESAAQIQLRAKRLDVDCRNLPVIAEHQVEPVLAALRSERPDIVIVDSVQTLQASSSDSPPGSVAQLKAVTSLLTVQAKSENIAMILVGHVTRTGSIAGPRVVEHLVDTVLYLEGEASSPLRVLRGVKNRFGSTLEVGLLEMTATGLRDGSQSLSLATPAGVKRAPGVAVSALLEGSRAFLVEVQALVASAVYGPPRLTTVGIDKGRVQMLAAVLERHVGDTVANTDLYVNIVGGLRLNDPSCDLAVLLALASSARERDLPADLWVVGEVGLTGELRPITGLDVRVGEAARAGYKRLIVPAMHSELSQSPDNAQIIRVQHLKQVVELAFGDDNKPSKNKAAPQQNNPRRDNNPERWQPQQPQKPQRPQMNSQALGAINPDDDEDDDPWTRDEDEDFRDE
jgi:DNA repair protein RadA/Sms